MRKWTAGEIISIALEMDRLASRIGHRFHLDVEKLVWLGLTRDEAVRVNDQFVTLVTATDRAALARLRARPDAEGLI